MARRLLILCIILVAFASKTTVTHADENISRFITIVNIARSAPYTTDLLSNIKAQNETLTRYNKVATWLLTYDALDDVEVVEYLKKHAPNHEFGIWAEVTPSLAQQIGLADYDTSLSWHYAKNIFPSGYPQSDRIKIIDEYFSMFKTRFGTYPSTVGSWWSDSFSLSYMSDQYGVNANVGVADQFSTDGYQVWGQHFSTPFLVSNNNTALPEVNSDIVQLQWAARDPKLGYRSSLYSLQDYEVSPVNRDIEYFKDLIGIYLNSEADIHQITVGLESDLPSEDAYQMGSQYDEQISYIRTLETNNEVRSLSVSEFVSLAKNMSNRSIITSIDKSTYWIQNNIYRVGIEIDEQGHQIRIFDLRFYDTDFIDPYFYSPNRDLKLEINIPSIIDRFQDGRDWVVAYDTLEINQDNNISFKLDSKLIVFEESHIEVINIDIPDYILSHPQITFSDNQITLNQDAYTEDLYTITGFTPEARSFFSSRKFILLAMLLSTVFISLIFLLLKKKKYSAAVVVVLFCSIAIIYQVFSMRKPFLVTQSELDTLYKLSTLEKGRVLVFNKECLQCEYHTPIKPAAFAGITNYISDISENNILVSSELNKLDRQSAYDYLRDNNIQYIYVLKLEKYQEKMPYQPGDLGVGLIYSNANTELWKIK